MGRQRIASIKHDLPAGSKVAGDKLYTDYAIKNMTNNKEAARVKRMAKLLRVNWFIWIVSFIPGLGLMLLGKRRLGLGIAVAIGLLLTIFWLVPTLTTWYIFGIAFIAQMAYAVGLSTSPVTGNKGVAPNSKLAHKLPDRFSDKKQIVGEVSKSLSTILVSDEHLLGAVIGQKQDSSQYLFIGVTQEYLILSECNDAGNPSNPKRIPKDDVQWISLQIGVRNLVLTIEKEDESKMVLYVPGKLQEQAKLILKEFPGTWENDNFVEGILTLQKDGNRSGAIIVYGISIALYVAGLFVTDGLVLLG